MLPEIMGFGRPGRGHKNPLKAMTDDTGIDHYCFAIIFVHELVGELESQGSADIGSALHRTAERVLPEDAAFDLSDKTLLRW